MLCCARPRHNSSTEDENKKNGGVNIKSAGKAVETSNSNSNAGENNISESKAVKTATETCLKTAKKIEKKTNSNDEAVVKMPAEIEIIKNNKTTNEVEAKVVDVKEPLKIESVAVKTEDIGGKVLSVSSVTETNDKIAERKSTAQSSATEVSKKDAVKGISNTEITLPNNSQSKKPTADTKTSSPKNEAKMVSENEKEVEIYTKYVEKLEKLSSIIEHKFSNPIESNQSSITTCNIDGSSCIKDNLPSPEKSNAVTYTVKNDNIFMSSVQNQNDISVGVDEGKKEKMEVDECFRCCVKVQCDVDKISIRASKKFSVILECCKEVVITDSEYIQVQVLNGLEKFSVINSSEAIAFVDSKMQQCCQFLSTKCSNFNIVKVQSTNEDEDADDNKSTAYSVPDQMLTKWEDDKFNTYPFVFTF